ncbi:MAG: tRNA (adenosine(37)-N6)-dimethylallyltransferase MiaA [Chthoniobacterales bacterium]
MKHPFYIVGATATGKSEIAAAVAQNCDGEIVSADAFQIYAGLDLLTAKPPEELRGLVRHHLIGSVDPAVEMNAAEFRRLALAAIAKIHARGKHAFVVGGSGMYLKALTHGLSPLPAASESLRTQLNQLSEGELLVRLRAVDPVTARAIDAQNKRRLVRAVEICQLTGRPASAQRLREESIPAPAGVFVFRERDDLYARINARVQSIFAQGVADEVRAAAEQGTTAAQTLGLRQIRELLAGKISEPECIAQLQQATRHYAKRQLTWFQRQTNFEPLNLSHHGSSDAIEWISRKARLSFTTPNV